MTLHIYMENGNQKSLTATLDFNSLNLLSPFLDEFKKSTGIYINEYDDIILAPNHAKLLAKLLESFCTKKDIPKKVANFYIKLKEASELDLYLYFVGE